MDMMYRLRRPRTRENMQLLKKLLHIHFWIFRPCDVHLMLDDRINYRYWHGRIRKCFVENSSTYCPRHANPIIYFSHCITVRLNLYQNGTTDSINAWKPNQIGRRNFITPNGGYSTAQQWCPIKSSAVPQFLSKSKQPVSNSATELFQYL